jgi:GNAT superfamily N-acetyltransferase
MQVRALQTIEEFQQYANFGYEVYRDNPYWVPPDPHFLIDDLSGEGPTGEHAQVQAFWVEDGGRILATLTAVVSDLYNRHWNEHMGHLFFFEALPDCDEAVRALIRTACDWLRGRGCRAARMSFLPGWPLPLTIDAYDAVPAFIHTYNHPHYHSCIKNGGFKTECGVVQYQVQFTPELARRYQEMVERAALAGVRLRSFDVNRLEEETALMADLNNETFAAHWGFQPITVPVMAGLTVGLKDFLVPDFIQFAEADGQPVGFVYALPDLNQAFHRMKGKVIEENLADFQYALQEIDHGLLLIIGVKQSYRGRGINLALAAKSYLAMIERGYKTGSYTVVLDDNWPSRRTAEKLGAKVTRNFIVYRRDLA